MSITGAELINYLIEENNKTDQYINSNKINHKTDFSHLFKGQAYPLHLQFESNSYAIITDHNGKQESISRKSKNEIDTTIFNISEINELENDKLNDFSLQAFDISQNENMLALVIKKGYNKSALYIKDIQANKYLYKKEHVFSSLAWLNNTVLVYIENDSMLRPVYARKLTISRNEITDKILYREKNLASHLIIRKNSEHNDIFLISKSTNHAKCGWLSHDQIHYFFNKKPWTFCEINSNKEHLFLLVKHLNKIKLIQIEKNNLKHITILHTWLKSTNIKLIAAISNYIFLRENDYDSRSATIQVYSLNTFKLHKFKCPFADIQFLHYNRGNNTISFKYTVIGKSPSVFTLPFKLFDLLSFLRKQQLAINSPYSVKIENCLALDNCNIPITIISRKENVSQKLPLVLYVYGAYGVDSSYLTDPLIKMIIDSGMHFCIAHIKGGGEKGIAWHKDGVMNRINAFQDLLYCVDYLIQHKYTAKGMITCYGRSAGALPILFALKNRPNRFNGAVLISPFVPHLSSSHPQVIDNLEMGEWGPFQKTITFKSLKKFDSFIKNDNKPYKKWLILTNVFDHKINYSDVLTWVEELRKNKPLEVFLHLDFYDFHGDPNAPNALRKKYTLIHSYICKINQISSLS